MSQTKLPPWRSVLAVVAHPDDESFALGAVLAAFAEAGAQESVLCLTRGEASTLHGVAGDLTELRADELTAAAAVLGLHDVTLLAYPDGRLPEVDVDQLAGPRPGFSGRFRGFERPLSGWFPFGGGT